MENERRPKKADSAGYGREGTAKQNTGRKTCYINQTKPTTH